MKLTLLDQHRSENFTYQDTSFISGIFQHFNICRHDSRFIDLEVEVQGVVFPCHQILLDAFCPYFAAHFSFDEQRTEEEGGDGRGKKVERVSLKYDGMTAEGFSALLDFLYTAELEINTDNVIDVLCCADFLQFHQVVHLCSTFLHQHITADTCIQMLIIAEAHGLHDLADKVLGFILSDISEVILQEEFTHLSKEVLVRIVSDSRLRVKTEMTVVEAILVWIKGCKKQRCPLLPELLKHARLHASDMEELRKKMWLENAEIIDEFQFGVTENAEIASRTEGKDLIKDSEDSIKNAKKSTHLTADLNCDDLTESGLPSRLREVLVVVSRKTEYETANGRQLDWRKVYSYNPETKTWELRTTVPFSQREGYTVTAVSNRMHLTGGQSLGATGVYGARTIFDDHVMFDPLDGNWEQRQHMLVPRFNHSAAAMLSKLYVVGGQRSFDMCDLQADGEVYDPATNQWTFISSVRCVSGIGNAALTSLNGKLYILGGVFYNVHQRGEAIYESYSGAQIYDPELDIWQELVSLEREITRRHLRLSSGGVLAVDGFLILLDDDVGKKHHVYNPVSQMLTPLMQAHGHHWFAGWAMSRGRLMSTGGLEQGKLGMTDMVHAWDLSSDIVGWQMMPSLPKPLSHHACLCLHFPCCEDDQKL